MNCSDKVFSRVQTWNLLEGGRLFRAVKDGRLNDEQHLAEMVSLIGPPPKTFLERSEKCRQYWDVNGRLPLLYYYAVPPSSNLRTGNWVAQTPIPNQVLESRETHLRGRNKDLFLIFVRKILCWLPEERPAAQDILEDEYLMLHALNDKKSA